MLDLLRTFLNQHARLAAGLCLGAVAVFGAAAFWPGGASAADGDPRRAWFHDTVTGELFVDSARRVAPFVNEDGHACVRALRWRAGGESETIGYEKFSPEVRRLIEEADDLEPLHDKIQSGLLYSVDGRTWMPADSDAARDLHRRAMDRLRARCTQGERPVFDVPGA